MIIKDLGAVTAYAAAVEKGYTGTEEEFATLMASYATVAEEAAESAESASQSASTATTKASEASASASTASTKASEASTSATTASTKASEASASATSAQTAQGLAESARDDAIGAKTDAETARDLAQQYAESIDPENIFSAYATDTASGAVATFTDGADDIPMKSVKVAIEPVQSGSGDPSPDNIRPISGWTGAQVVRSGVNVWDEEWESGYINNSTGEFIASQNYICTKNFISIVPGKSYYIKTPVALKLIAYDANKTFLRAITSTWANEVITGSTHLSDVYYIKFYNAASGALTTYNHDISINYPSTDHDYHSFTGNDTYSITFPSEAGTVYGGMLDVTNGVLTVDRAFIASYNGETLPSEWISDRDKYVAGTTPTTGAQVCYKLSQAVVYALTPTEIKSLLGDNNIWADAGNTEVTYRADTTKYIDKRIGTEAPMIATDNIVSGSYFMIGNNLYKATANIASGAAVVVGTNAVAITMAEALNEINA